MMRRMLVPFVLLSALIAGCGQEEAERPAAGKQASAQAQTLPATVLWFREQEPGVEPYATRMIVTRDWLRMDEGRDDGDFLLYDRRTRSIHSVAHDDRTVLDIPFHEVGIEPPYALETVRKTEIDEAAPTVAGKRPARHRDFVNAKLCLESVSVPGLLEEARKALEEYQQALAGEQARNLYKTPEELQDPCMLSNLIFAPGKNVAEGFPIYERSYTGYARELTDFREGQQVDARLFELPTDYRHYRIQVQPDGQAPQPPAPEALQVRPEDAPAENPPATG